MRNVEPGGWESLLRHLPGMAYRRIPDRLWTVTRASEGARGLFGDLAWERLDSGKPASAISCMSNAFSAF